MMLDPVVRHRCLVAITEVSGMPPGDTEILEQRVFLASFGALEAYMNKMTQLIHNMKVSDVWKKYITEDFSLLVGLDDAALNPMCPVWAEQAAYNQQLADAEELLSVFAKDSGDRSVDERSSIQCSRCKSYDIDIECKQTRSSDEPMTIFCECLNPTCGAKWKTY